MALDLSSRKVQSKLAELVSPSGAIVDLDARNASTVLEYPPSNLTASISTTTLTSGSYGNGTYIVSSIWGGVGTFADNNNWVTTNTFYDGVTGMYSGTVSTSTNDGNIYLGDWLQIQFPERIKLQQFSIMPVQADGAGFAWAILRSPRKFAIVGSNDGLQWNTLFSISNLTTWSKSTKAFSVNTNNSYSYFRMIISENGNYPSNNPYGSGQRISEISRWRLFGTPATFASAVPVSSIGTFSPPSVVQNGLIAHLDPSNASSYSGTGATIYNLVDGGTIGTLGGTYNSTSGGINLVNTGLSDTANTSNLQLASLAGIRTMSIWYRQNSSQTTTRYLLDARSGSANSWIFSGSIGNPTWYDGTNGTLYKNGGSSITPTWAAIETVGSWQNITLISTTSITDDITLFSRFSRDQGGLNVTFGPILVYNRAITQAENESNFNAIRTRYSLDGGMPKVTVETPLSYATGGFNNGSYISTVSSTDSYYGNTFRISGNTSNNGEIYFNSSSNIVFYIINRSNSSTFAFNQATTTWLTERSFTYTQLGVSASSPFEFLVEFTQTHFIIKKSDGTFVGIYTNVIPNDRIISTSLFGITAIRDATKVSLGSLTSSTTGTVNIATNRGLTVSALVRPKSTSAVTAASDGVYPPAAMTSTTTSITGQTFGNGTYVASSSSNAGSFTSEKPFDKNSTTYFANGLGRYDIDGNYLGNNEIFPPAAMTGGSTTFSGLTTANGTYTVAVSSTSSGSAGYLAMDRSTSGSSFWNSATSVYNTAGSYIGSSSAGSTLGEWIYLTAPTHMTPKSVTLTCLDPSKAPSTFSTIYNNTIATNHTASSWVSSPTQTFSLNLSLNISSGRNNWGIVVPTIAGTGGSLRIDEISLTQADPFTTTDTMSTVHKGEWIQLQLPNSIYLRSFILSSSAYQPKQFALLGSKDASTWDLIYNTPLDTSITIGGNTFLTNNANLYNYFRLVVKKVNGDSFLRLYEMSLAQSGAPQSPLTIFDSSNIDGTQRVHFGQQATFIHPLDYIEAKGVAPIVITETNGESFTTLSGSPTFTWDNSQVSQTLSKTALVLMTDPTATFGNNSTMLTYQFVVPVTTTYNIQIQTLQPNGNNDSLFVSLNGNTAQERGVVRQHFNLFNAQSASSYTLTAGTHTLTIQARERGALGGIIVRSTNGKFYGYSVKNEHMYSAVHNGDSVYPRITSFAPKRITPVAPTLTGNLASPVISLDTRGILGATTGNSIQQFSGFTQGTVTAQPTYNTSNSYQNLPYLSFNRTNSQFLGRGSTTFNIATNGGFSCYLLVRLTDAGGSYDRIFDFGTTAQNTTITLFRGIGSDINSLFVELRNGTTMVGGSGAIPIIQNTWIVIGIRYRVSTNTLEVFSNGSLLGTSTVSATVTDRTISCFLAQSPTGGNRSNMDLASLYMYDRALSDADLTTLYSLITTPSYSQSLQYDRFQRYTLTYNDITGDVKTYINNNLVGTDTAVNVYPPQAMTANTTSISGSLYANGSYIASASSFFSGTEDSFYAFNKNKQGDNWTISSNSFTTPFYSSTSGSYIKDPPTLTTIGATNYAGEVLQIQFPVSIRLTKYTLVPRTNDLARSPKDFWIFGSTDGSAWVLLDTRTGQTSWSSLSNSYTVNSSNYYNYFRIVVNSNNGSIWLSIGEWELFGTEQITNKTLTTLNIGKSLLNAGTTSDLDIADLRVYDRELTSSELSTINNVATKPKVITSSAITNVSNNAMGIVSLDPKSMNFDDGTPVAEWNGFSQSTDSRRPIYRGSGGYNNGPYLEFKKGSKQFLSTSAASTNFQIGSNGGFTIAGIARFSGDTPTLNERIVELNSQNSTSGYGSAVGNLAITRSGTDTNLKITSLNIPSTTDAVSAVSTWVTRASAANNNWLNMCWSPELSLFVAVGDSGSGNRVMTSPDGFTWTTRSTPVDNGWHSVCWSPELSLFVAVAYSGSGNHVMTSSDGITWVSRTSIDNQWLSVTWSSELRLFVAVSNSGIGNRVMTSSDGITWVSRSSAVDNDWHSVVWASELSLFVAVAYSGTGNRVMTSPDGINWTSRTSAANNEWISVCWSRELSLFVAVGRTSVGNRVMTSPNGINWTTRTSAGDIEWRTVTWSSELKMLVAVGISGIMSSPDGITWSSRSMPVSNSWTGVAWAPELGIFAAVAITGTGNRVMTSSPIKIGIETDTTNNLIYKNEWVPFAARYRATTPAEAITAVSTWTTRASAANNSWTSVVWAPELGIFVAVSETGSGNRVMTSPDGITWTSRVSAADNNWRSVTWSPELSLFVAVAYSGTGNRVMTSSDGLNWVTRTSAADNSWYSVTWSSQLAIFVATAITGSGNRVMTSSDGIVWTTQTSAANNSWNSVIWVSELGLFVAVAYTGTGNRVMTSPDGINWTTRASAANNQWYTVAWSPKLRLLCAVADTGTGNRLMTSSDGITWTTRSVPDNPWSTISWSQELSLFIAIAYSNGSLITSFDGITWTTRTSIANNAWSCAVWSPELGIFVITPWTGTGNSVMTSRPITLPFQIYKGTSLNKSISSPILTDRTFTQMLLGKSSGEIYSNMDLAGLWMYDRPLSDRELRKLYNTITTGSSPDSQLTKIESSISETLDLGSAVYSIDSKSEAARPDVAAPILEYPPDNRITGNITQTTGTIIVQVSGADYGNGIYTFAASSVYNSGVYFPPSYLFESITQFFSTDSFWATDNLYNNATGVYTGTVTTIAQNGTSYQGEWVQIGLSQSIVLSSYIILPRQDNSLWPQRSPNTFVILGSNDGLTWNLVDMETSIGNWTSSAKTFTVNSSVAYRLYRMIISVAGNTNQTSNRTGVNISRWRLYGSATSTSSSSSVSLVYPPAPLTSNSTTVSNTSTSYAAGTYTASASTTTTGSAFTPFGSADTLVSGRKGYWESALNFNSTTGGFATAATTWTTRSNIGVIRLFSVCWSPELSLFVSPSYNASGVLISSDGITWSTQSAPTLQWTSICWSSELSLFVAVAENGTGNRVMTSSNGINWTTRTSAVDNNWWSVTWSPELRLFAAVSVNGTGNRVMTSPDGVTWTSRASAADNSWIEVCWSKELSLFVAVAQSGTGNRVMTSSDGIVWVSRSSPLDNAWTSICWSSELSLFVSVAASGTGNRVMTSSNGINWVTRSSPIDNNWDAVIWVSEIGLFVAVANSGSNRVMTSSDGINWVTRSITSAGYNSVVYSSQLNLFVTVSGNPSGNFITSSGGLGNESGEFIQLQLPKAIAPSSFTILPRQTAPFDSASLYLPFDNSITDRSTNGNLMTMVGTQRYTTSAVVGTSSLYLANEANVSAVTLAANYLSNSTYTFGNTYTVSTWINATSFGNSDSIFFITNSMITSNLSGGVHLAIASGTRIIRSAFYGGSAVQTSFAATTGTWYHIAYTLSGTTLTLYVNGILIGSTTGTPSHNGFKLGDSGNTTFGQPFAGYIDDFTIYNRVLTAAEIASLSTPPSLRSPRYFLALGSTNGSNWDLLYRGSDVSWTTAAQKFPVVNSKASKYFFFRLLTTRVGNAGITSNKSSLQIAGLTFEEVITGSTSTVARAILPSQIQQADTSKLPRLVTPTTILEFPPRPLTANTTTITTADYANGTYIASASSVLGQNGAYLVFESSTVNIDNFWHSNTTYNSATGNYAGSVTTTAVNGVSYLGEWIQINLPTAIKLQSCSLLPRLDFFTQRSPEIFYILGSNDGTAWNLIYTSSQSSWTSSTTRFNINCNQSYMIYRLVVNTVVGRSSGNSVQIGRWQLFGTLADNYLAFSAAKSQSLSIPSKTYDIATGGGFAALAKVRLGAPSLTARPQKIFDLGSSGTSSSAVNNLTMDITTSGNLRLTSFNIPSTTDSVTSVTTWTTRSSAVDNSWNSVVWSPELSLFVAIPFGGSQIMTSLDGINWISRTCPVSNNWTSVTWAPELSLFVAVSETGSGNRVMTSNDGVVWTSRSSAADINWNSVCWSNELFLFVAVAWTGTGNQVMTSPDGITWTTRATNTNSWLGVTWSRDLGLFVAVAGSGTGNRVMTSSDGITWVTRTSAADNGWRAVTWSRELSLFVAVAASGTGNRVMTSPDGITWITRTSAADNDWTSICWSSELSLFVAIAASGTGNRIMTSLNGITWTTRASAVDNGWRSIAWSPQLGVFAAVSNTGTGNRVMTTSSVYKGINATSSSSRSLYLANEANVTANPVTLASNYLVNSTYNFGSSYTVSTWINATVFKDPNNVIFITNSMITSNLSGGVHFAIMSSNRNIRAGFYGGNAVDTSFSATINTWYHLVYTLSGTTLVFYVNGTLIGTASGTPVNSGFKLGDAGNPVSTAPFAGYIDNFTIYNRVLAASEISYLAANPSLSSPLDSTAVYLPFDGTISSPGIATRLIGTERYGPGVGDLIAPNQWVTLGARYTRSNAVVALDARQLSTQLVNSQGVYDWSNFYQQTSSARPTYISSGGYAGNPYISFNRTNSQFLQLPSITLNIASNGGFTAIALVRFNGTTTYWERIFEFGNGVSNDNILIGRNGNTTGYTVELRNGSTIYALNAPSQIIQNEWRIYSCRYTLSTNLVELFVNGTIVASSTSTITLTNRTLTTNFIANTAWTGISSANIDISSLYIFDRALPDTELGSLTQNLLSGAVPLTETLELSVNGKPKFMVPVNAPIGSRTVAGTVARTYTGGLYPTFSNLDLASLYLFDRALSRSEMDSLTKLVNTQSESSSSLTRTTRYTPSTTRIVQVPPATSQTITSNTFSITDAPYANGTFVVSTSSERSGRESYRVFNYNTTDQFGTPSGTYNTTTGSQRLNLDLTGTGYLGSWIRLQMPYNLRLTRYQIKAAGVIVSTRAPRDFALFGSTDNITWTKLDDRSNISFGAAEEKVFTVSTNTSYRYLSIIINRIGATDTAEIDNLKFFGVIDPATTAPTVSARYLKLTNSPSTPRLEVTDILNRTVASNAPVVRNDILKNFVTPMISSPLASRNYTPIQNGLVAWFDPNDPVCYSGTGATMASLVGNVSATIGGTNSFANGTIRLVNNTNNSLTNSAFLNIQSLSNVRTISIWYYQHSLFDGWTYLLAHISNFYITNLGINFNGIIYKNGGSSQSVTWANIQTLGRWQNITIISNNDLSGAVRLFGYSLEGLDVTFGPVLVYNRVITQAENETNFNEILVNYFSTPNPTLPITNGLTAWFDPSDTRCYPGSGATLGSLVMSGTTGSFVSGTVGGTYSYDSTSNGIRLVNNSVTSASNVSYLQLSSVPSITTVSLWYYQHSGTIVRYLLDGRTGSGELFTTGFIYNDGAASTNWSSGILYKNGGSAQTITWSNIETLGIWQNITVIANTPFTDDITFFARTSLNEGLDVTFGPILIYNRALTESENRINYEIINRKLLARASQKIQPSLVAKSTLMYPPVSLTADSVTISNSSTSYGAGTYSLLASSTSGTISADGLINLDSRSLSSTNGASVSNWGGFTQGTLANQPVYYTTGGGFNNMPYLSFNRTNSQFLNRGSTTLNIQTNGGFTALALVRFTGTVASSERIFDFGSGAPNNNITLGRSSTTGNILLIMCNSTTASSYVTTTNPIVQNEWAVFGCRYNDSTRLTEIFKNGVSIGSTTLAITITDRTVTNSYIGRSNWGVDAYSNIDIAGLYIYDRALSNVDLATAYNNLTSYSLSYNAFDGTGGSMWSSSNFVYNTTSGTISTNGVVNADARALTLSSVSRVSNWSGFTQGTLANQPFFYKVGGYNGGPFVRFNSANSTTLRGGLSGAFNVATNGGFTALALFKFNGPIVAWENILYWGDASSNRFIMSRNNTTGNVFVSLYSDDNTSRYVGQISTAQNEWCVCSLRFNSSTKLAQIYKNNSVVASSTLAGTFGNLTITNSVIGEFPANIDVGGVYIYNTALSDADLTTAHNNLTSYSNSYNGAYTGTVTSNDLYGNAYTGEYLQFKLPDPVYPSSLAITPDPIFFASSSPTSFTLLGSSNDLTYTPILTTTTSWASNATKTFLINGTTGSSVPFNNYRLVTSAIGSNNTFGNVSLSEVQVFGSPVASSISVQQFPPSSMTADTTATLNTSYGSGTYIASASSYLGSPGYEAYKSFILNGSAGWSSDLRYSVSGLGAQNGSYIGTTGTLAGSATYYGEWIQLQTPNLVVLDSISIRSYFGTYRTDRFPRRFYILGSRDGSTWSLVSMQTTVNFNDQRYYAVNSKEAYNYFRFVINSIGDPSASPLYRSVAAIGSIALYGREIVNPIREFPPGPMTANTTTLTGYPYSEGTYVASASSSIEGVFTYYTFDNNINTYWHSGVASTNLYNTTTGSYVGTTTMTAGSTGYAGEWIGIQMPSKVTLDSISITLRQDNNLWSIRSLNTFYLFGSNDGSTWDLVKSFINVNEWTQSARLFPVNASRSYTYFRLLTTNIGQAGVNSNRNSVQIAEWRLYGEESTTSNYTVVDLGADTSVSSIRLYNDVSTSSASTNIVGGEFSLFNSGGTQVYTKALDSQKEIYTLLDTTYTDAYSMTKTPFSANFLSHNESVIAFDSKYTGTYTNDSSSVPFGVRKTKDTLALQVGSQSTSGTLVTWSNSIGISNSGGVAFGSGTAVSRLFEGTTSVGGGTIGPISIIAPTLDGNLASPVAFADVRNLTGFTTGTKVSSINSFTQTTGSAQPTFSLATPFQNMPYISFDRNNSQFLNRGSTTLNIATNGGFTALALVRFTGTAGAWERIVQFGPGTGSNAPDSIVLSRYSSTNGLSLSAWNGSTTILFTQSTGGEIVQNEWAVLGCRYNNNTGSLQFLKNGNITSSVNASSGLTNKISVTSYIGRPEQTLNDAFSNMDLASLYAYDRALSDVELDRLYRSMITPLVRISIGRTLPSASYTAFVTPEMNTGTETVDHTVTTKTTSTFDVKLRRSDGSSWTNNLTINWKLYQ